VQQIARFPLSGACQEGQGNVLQSIEIKHIFQRPFTPDRAVQAAVVEIIIQLVRIFVVQTALLEILLTWTVVESVLRLERSNLW